MTSIHSFVHTLSSADFGKRVWQTTKPGFYPVTKGILCLITGIWRHVQNGSGTILYKFLAFSVTVQYQGCWTYSLSVFAIAALQIQCHYCCNVFIQTILICRQLYFGTLSSINIHWSLYYMWYSLEYKKKVRFLLCLEFYLLLWCQHFDVHILYYNSIFSTGVPICCRGSLRCYRVSGWTAAPSSQSLLPAPAPPPVNPPLRPTQETSTHLASWPAVKPASGSCAALRYKKRHRLCLHLLPKRQRRNLRHWSWQTTSQKEIE